MTREEKINEAVKLLNEVNQKGEIYKYSFDKTNYTIFIKNGFVYGYHLSQMKYLYIEIFHGKLMIQF